MNGEKMADNEIIRALECCVGYEKCDICPMYEKCEFFYDREYVGIPDILTLSLELVRKQKENIDKLELNKKL